MRRELKVGLLAIVVLAALLAGIGYLQGTSVFQTHLTVQTVYPQVKGLAPGNDVTYNGMRVGRVRELDIDGMSGEITVTFDFMKELRIPKDSYAVLYSPSPISASAIKIIAGESTEPIQTGDVLRDSIEIGLISLISSEFAPVKAKLENILDNTAAITASVATVLGDSTKFERLTDNFVATSDNIASITGNLANAMGRVDTASREILSILDSLERSTGAVTRIAENTATITDTLSASSSDFKAAMASTRLILEDLQVVTTQLRQGEGSAGKLIYDDSLYVNLTNAANSLDLLLLELKTNPQRFVQFSLFGRKDRSAIQDRRDERRDERKEERAERKDGDDEPSQAASPGEGQ